MRLTIPQPQLADLLGAVVKVAPSRSSIPIGSAALLDASEGLLRATCTDFDMAVSASSSAEISAPGKCCPQAATLAQFVKALPRSGSVEVILSGDRLTLRCGRARATFPCLPPEDFPLRTLAGAEHRLSLPGSVLAETLDKVSFAVSAEETRYYLNGVHLASDSGALVFSATDGHRLATRRVPVNADGMPAIIIPRAALPALSMLAVTGDVDFTVTETGLRATAGNRSLVTKLVDGTFPDIERVVPREVERPALVDRLAATESLRRVVAVADSDGNARVAKLAFNGTLTVSAGAPDKGDAEEEIDCSDAPEIEIGFNTRYLLDALSAAGGETVEMHMESANHPMLLRNPNDAALRIVVMPMRI